MSTQILKSGVIYKVNDLIPIHRANDGYEDNAMVVPDRADAIARAIRFAGPDDAVLIAGKGHETVQVAGETRRPFSDVAVAAAALSARVRDA